MEKQQGSADCACATWIVRLELFFFLSGREAGDAVASGIALCADPDEGFAFGAGFAHNYHGAKGFRVQTGHEIDVAGAVFLPKLADLNFRDAHSEDLTVVGRGCGCQLVGGVCCSETTAYKRT